jgi:hypothetical protein
VWTVIVAMMVEALTPDEAVALVLAELAAKLPREDQSWQTEAHHLLPRYVVGGRGAQHGSTSRVGRQDEETNKRVETGRCVGATAG